MPHPGEYLRLHPLQCNRCAETKKYGPNENRSKLQKKNEEIASLSGAEFKTLVIRMLTEMIGHGHKIKEEVTAIQQEVKKNIQGTNSDEKETRTQINDLEQKEEINIQSKQNAETRIQRNEKRLRNLWDNFKRSNI